MAAGSPMSPVAPGQAENQTKQTGARPKQKKVMQRQHFYSEVYGTEIKWTHNRGFKVYIY